jgi:drug/metabolite transporter (DMT)-like permease
MAGSSTGPNAARGDRAAYMLLVLATLAFGGTWVAGKLAVASIPPMTIAAGRFMIASVLLWMWMKSSRLPARPLTAADLPTILAMGLTAVAGYNVLFLNGLRLAPASDGAIIVPAFAPIMTAALAWLWQGERVRAAGLMGFLAATVGLALVDRAPLPGSVRHGGELRAAL